MVLVFKIILKIIILNYRKLISCIEKWFVKKIDYILWILNFLYMYLLKVVRKVLWFFVCYKMLF